MSTRHDALKRIQSVVDGNPDYITRWFSAKRFYDYIESFNDETIEMLDAALRDDAIKHEVTNRFMLLLSSGQHRRLEPVVRNIIVFARTEAVYRESLDLRGKSWKVTHGIEKFARKYICGSKGALETTEQARLMNAAAHAVFAVTLATMRKHGLESVGAGYIAKDISSLLYDNLESSQYGLFDVTGAFKVIEFFVSRPEDAEQLSAVVAELGIVSSEVLSAALEIPKSVRIGVL